MRGNENAAGWRLNLWRIDRSRMPGDSYSSRVIAAQLATHTTAHLSALASAGAGRNEQQV